MTDHADIATLARTVVAELTKTNKALATAESCTGGWIAKAVTDVAGSSAVFGYGIVSYANGAKESMLGVQNATLEEHGSVSQAVVEEMATGALRLSGADIAVAVSGIAGPSGGSEEKPVGTVWFAWATRSDGAEQLSTHQELINGDRERIREATVVHALQGVLERISS